MDLMTTKEVAEIWGISARRVALLCSQGRITGAVKKGKTWLIPSDVEKPEDPRKNRKIQNKGL
ncbi:MAG: helix-turn-helix domain-containing protein [Bacillota bacterium]|nr:helix-turn-helix domain-containing protein [Bacillota bacterium]